MPKIAIFHDEKVLLDKDMAKLKSILVSELANLEGIELVELSTDRATPPADALGSYDLAVFCGYSLSLFSVLFSALNQGVAVLLYDLPGDSIERELSSLLFSGLDSQRLPSTVLSKVTHSWTYRDIVGICKQMAKDAPQRATTDVDRTRSVEDSGKAPTRKRIAKDAARAEG